jgi:serine/threonine protein kinase
VFRDQKRGVVLKQYNYERNFRFHAYEYMRMDSLVNERLSWSSRIINIYGFCGLSVINEAATKDLESVAVPGKGRPSEPLNDTLALDVRNNLTGTQKLEFALAMFEATSLLHAYPGGVMVHDDIQLTQFLIVDGSLKLNDFNRAEIMLFNEKDQEYCRYRNDPGQGDWRAPEEYFDYPLSEKIDVWSLGNNMYSLLTGRKSNHNCQFGDGILPADSLPLLQNRQHDEDPKTNQSRRNGRD